MRGNSLKGENSLTFACTHVNMLRPNAVQFQPRALCNQNGLGIQLQGILQHMDFGHVNCSRIKALHLHSVTDVKIFILDDHDSWKYIMSWDVF